MKKFNRYLFGILLFIILFSLMEKASGQSWKKYSNWYFGHNAAIRFNNTTDPPVFISGSDMSEREGTASISDDNGNLMFYTNGKELWNSQHISVYQPGGAQMMAGDATQNVMILPKPYSSNQFYIITTQNWRIDATSTYSGGRAYYSQVDVTGSSPNYVVTFDPSKYNVLLNDEGVTEQMTATCHAQAGLFWLIMHEDIGNKFLFYIVDGNGISFDHYESINPGITTTWGAYAAPGQMKISPNGKLFAFTTAYQKQIGIYDLNINSNPILSNVRIIDQSDTKCGFYGLEFSPDSKLLYASGGDGPDSEYDLYQYRISDQTKIYEWKSNVFYTDVDGNKYRYDLYNMQLGPDNRIYVTSWEWLSGYYSFLPRKLHSILDPNVEGAGCNFIQGYVDLNNHLSETSLPHIPFYECQTCNCPDPNLWPTSAALEIAYTDASTGLQVPRTYTYNPSVKEGTNVSLFINEAYLCNGGNNCATYQWYCEIPTGSLPDVSNPYPVDLSTMQIDFVVPAVSSATQFNVIVQAFCNGILCDTLKKGFIVKPDVTCNVGEVEWLGKFGFSFSKKNCGANIKLTSSKSLDLYLLGFINCIGGIPSYEYSIFELNNWGAVSNTITISGNPIPINYVFDYKKSYKIVLNIKCGSIICKTCVLYINSPIERRRDDPRRHDD